MTTPGEIPFNKPFIAGRELFYIAQAVTLGNIGGDGHFTQQCSKLLEKKFRVPRVLLTPSCTSALEIAAILCELQPGDEVIMPSYTFVSTATAFVRTGAVPVFVDIRPDTLNIDENKIEAAVTERTKAICVVHYAGVACEMNTVMKVAAKHEIMVIEDAAQGVNATYRGQYLGTIGDLGCFSFHETKNFICGEGGALCINRPDLIARANIIRDKGTNRQQFLAGDTDKYSWVDVGSSYVPSEISSAFLFGQLEEMERISQRRQEIYRNYYEGTRLAEKEGLLQRPRIPTHCGTNYHLFFIILPSSAVRDHVLAGLRGANIHAVFHYVPLHNSPMGRKLTQSLSLPITEDLSGRLLRLPFYHDLTQADQQYVIDTLIALLQ